MENIFEGKDILVTGGCGSIGSEIVRQLLKFNPKKIRVFDNDENGHWQLNQQLKSDKIRNLIGDVRDRERLERAINGVNIVFHAAALKHVDLCEYNPDEAVYTNVIGTKNLVEAAAEEKDLEKFIGISTDKAVNPINTMGATKLLSEKLIINAPHKVSKALFSVVRFGNVLNSSGSVIPIFKRQIAEGDRITITLKDMVRYFITIGDAVNLIFKAAKIMKDYKNDIKKGNKEAIKNNEIFILKMKAIKINDLAEVMIGELAPKYGKNPKKIKIEEIGPRKGEKISEALMTNEEAEYVREEDNLFIINTSIWGGRKAVSNAKKLDSSEYNASEAKLLSKKEIKELLYKDKIL